MTAPIRTSVWVLAGGVNSNSELVVAVSRALYGEQSNPNHAPICGGCALVVAGWNSVKVTIVHKCMDCQPDDTDLSPTAFVLMANPLRGRIKVSWNILKC
ncbi:hypothetical protein BV898_07591 [Hypsibius exemplaris]|uniref:RlpA-like protein double-psi beta-barrel domain-containing protein n=1 Tax=Hypsibius exemplaris TaxID=2072580 RepID=A0A1W0WT76_HYPEX|nr:hypothetical protein BV898_07591 [Hypsibius exemplaris]